MLNPPAADKYPTLKSRLISEFSDSEQRRIKAVLSEFTLGDEKPTHLLRKMKQLAGNILSDEILKMRWLQRLPNHVQAILSVSDDGLEKLAVMANKIHEMTGVNVEAVHSSKESISDMGELRVQVAELAREVQRLSRGREQRNSSSYQLCKHSKTPKKYDQCWYHFKFGDAEKALQIAMPLQKLVEKSHTLAQCEFKPNNVNSNPW